MLRFVLFNLVVLLFKFYIPSKFYYYILFLLLFDSKSWSADKGSSRCNLYLDVSPKTSRFEKLVILYGWEIRLMHGMVKKHTSLKFICDGSNHK